MFNYKRLTFIFLIISIFLLATDTLLEKQSRKSLLSLFDIVVEEGSQVTDSAPSSFLDTVETTRIAAYNFLSNESIILALKAQESTGPISLLFTIGNFALLILKFLTSYVITFYPFVIFLLYLFLTSRFFKKDEFAYDDF